jgi:hypothetical protein
MEHLWSQWLWRQAGGDDLEPLLEFLVVVNPFGLRDGSARDGKAFHSDSSVGIQRARIAEDC